jgi:hypothetical protein
MQSSSTTPSEPRDETAGVTPKVEVRLVLFDAILDAGFDPLAFVGTSR